MAAAGESSGPSRLDPSGRSRAAPTLRTRILAPRAGAGDGRSCAAGRPAGLAGRREDRGAGGLGVTEGGAFQPPGSAQRRRG